MTVQTLKYRQDIEDFVRGCAFFGTGGGGDPKRGFELLNEVLEQKKVIEWIDADEVPDDAEVISLFYMGSISPPEPDREARLADLNLKKRIANELVKAYREMEAYSGKSPAYVAAAEIGGVNTPAPIAAACELGLPIVNGDYGCGRANPEMTNSLVGVRNQPICPVVFCDYAGSVTVVKDAPSTKMTERIGKFISSASFGLVGSAGYMLSGRLMKEVLYRGTLTKALQLGRAIRKARESKTDPLQAALDYTSGWLLFKGSVIEKYWEDRDGYMYGYFILGGRDEFSTQKFKVWFKNENHISWLNDQPYVTSPDLITAVTLAEGEPLTNTDLEKGQTLAIIGVASGEPYRSSAGLAVMGPGHYGFDIDYTPIEQIMEK